MRVVCQVRAGAVRLVCWCVRNRLLACAGPTWEAWARLGCVEEFACLGRGVLCSEGNVQAVVGHAQEKKAWAFLALGL